MANKLNSGDNLSMVIDNSGDGHFLSMDIRPHLIQGIESICRF